MTLDYSDAALIKSDDKISVIQHAPLQVGKMYKITGYIRTPKGTKPNISNGDYQIWEGNDSGLLQYMEAIYTAIDETFHSNIPQDSHIDFDDIQIQDLEDDIVDAQPMTSDPTLTINGEKHKPAFTYNNVGDEWPRKCNKEDNHEGMIQNPITGEWSWL